jgi:hypothetical protein
MLQLELNKAITAIKKKEDILIKNDFINKRNEIRIGFSKNLKYCKDRIRPFSEAGRH